jgi:hypothetical protein
LEIHDLWDGTARDLPVAVFQRILLTAKNRAVLQNTSPDVPLEIQHAERTLKCERDMRSGPAISELF